MIAFVSHRGYIKEKKKKLYLRQKRKNIKEKKGYT